MADALESATRRFGGPSTVLGQVRGVGIVAWSIIGVAIVGLGVVAALGAVSELVLPLILAFMIGASTYPVARWLQDRGLKPGIAAATVVAASLVLIAGLAFAVVEAVVDQSGAITGYVDAAMEELEDPAGSVNVDPDDLQSTREAVGAIAGVVGRGLATLVVDGVGAVVGFVGGTVLAFLILYYVLKDGPSIRDAMVQAVPGAYRAEAEAFVTTSVRTLRNYWAGRAVLSAIVTAVVVLVCLVLGLPLLATIAAVTFVGGFVPYIGAVIGGGLATIIALGDQGLGTAIVLLLFIVFSNVVLENVLEPRIMGGHMSIHPLLVLLATTAGGVLGGIVGLIVAVPLVVVAIDLVNRVNRVAREARSA